MKKKIICKTCFNKWRFEKEDYCKIIETEGGGSIKADRTECRFYLKKGTEPKLLCSQCGKNTYGDASMSEMGKHYCEDCYWKKEQKKWLAKERLKKLENIKKVAEILEGDKYLAKKIVEAIKN